jgi:hypothetical protein
MYPYHQEYAMPATKSIDKTGIALFLGITFGTTITLSIVLWSRGVSLAEPLLGGLTGVTELLVLLPVAAWALRMSTKIPKTENL